MFSGRVRALLRKLVCNELPLGYLGEAYFYAWARRRSAMAAAPFAAIKDVSILSAMAGNGVTVVLVAALWPVLGGTSSGAENRAFLLSLSVVPAMTRTFWLTTMSFWKPERSSAAWRSRSRQLPMSLCIRVPGPCTYAVSLLHDTDSNRKFGWRVYGVGFSGNPKLGWSKPKAAQVAIALPHR